MLIYQNIYKTSLNMSIYFIKDTKAVNCLNNLLIK